MRSGFIVVGLLLAVSVVAAVALRSRYKSELVEIQDLTTGLLYFMEANNGRFPRDLAEFAASPMIERRDDGALVIRGWPDSRYRRETHGYPIRNIERFSIAWGADLAALREAERGRVVDAEGRAVELISWPSSPPSGKQYTLMLIAASRAIRGERESSGGAPSTQAAP